MATESRIADMSTTPNARKGARANYWKVFATLYLSFLLMIAMVAFAVGFPLHSHIERALQEEITRNLTQKAEMLANRINADHVHGIEVITSQEGQAAGARATVIDTNSQAIADSEVPVSALHDEGRSPEFVAALRGSTAVEIRSRNGARVLFVAVPVSGGAVRLAYPLAENEPANKNFLRALSIGCIAAALAGAGLSALISRTVLSD